MTVISGRYIKVPARRRYRRLGVHDFLGSVRFTEFPDGIIISLRESPSALQPVSQEFHRNAINESLFIVEVVERIWEVSGIIYDFLISSSMGSNDGEKIMTCALLFCHGGWCFCVSSVCVCQSIPRCVRVYHILICYCEWRMIIISCMACEAM